MPEEDAGMPVPGYPEQEGGLLMKMMTVFVIITGHPVVAAMVQEIVPDTQNMNMVDAAGGDVMAFIPAGLFLEKMQENRPPKALPCSDWNTAE